MKIDKYKVYDTGVTVGTEAQIFVNGALQCLGGSKLVNWSDVPKEDIIQVSHVAAVVTPAAWAQTYTPVVGAIGDEYVLTLEYPDSRQKGRKVFKDIGVAGDTPTTICNRFRAQVAASSLPLTGSGTSTLILTAVAEAGVNYIATLGATGTATFTAGAATADAQTDTSARMAARYEGVSASDFGSSVLFYIAYRIQYLSHIASSDGEIGKAGNAIIFVESAGASNKANLNTAIDGTYASLANAAGAIGVTKGA